MKFDKLRSVFVASMITISALFLVSASTASAGTPPVTCNEANDGYEWTDPETGEEYVCRYVTVQPFGVKGWFWVKKNASPAPRVSQEYSGSYGKVILSSGLTSNPDTGAAMVHSRTSSWGILSQGTGELRAKVVIQKWTGSSWTDCVNTGYSYSSGSYSEWSKGYNMYTYADCGAASYRVKAYGYMYDQGTWRGGIDYTASCWRN